MKSDNLAYSDLVDNIQYMDLINKKSVDDLVKQVYKQGGNVSDYEKPVSKKIAQFHKSDYDINSIEYLRKKFDISKQDKYVKKAVYKRGKNSMFKRLDQKEQKRLDKLCDNHSVSEKVEKAKKNPFNKFLAWYNKFEKKHPLIANMSARCIPFIMGDFITQMVVKGNYELRDFTILAPLTAYYGWETMKVYGLFDKIPISNYKLSAKEWLNPKLLGKNIKRKKGEILRNVAFHAYNFGLWLPRHFAFLELKKAQPLSQSLDNLATFDFAKTSTLMGLGQLPIVIPITHFIQNKIDIQYRILALGTVNIVWSSVASFLA